MSDEFKNDYDSGYENEEEKDKLKQERRVYKTGLVTGVIWGIGIVFALYLGSNILAEKLGGTGTASISSNETSADAKVNLLEDYIDKYYYEEVSQEQLNEGMYEGLVAALDDPYSEYYTEEDFEAVTSSSEGHYTGVGVVITQNPDTMVVTVSKVYRNSPAEKAGVEAGDIIIAVDGEDVTGISSDLLATKVRGKKGTKITITVDRNGKEIALEMNRDEVDVQVVAYEMLEENVGYIILDQFTDSAVEQFEEALIDLDKQGMERIIVDVRDNPGGLLTSVQSILSMFLPKDELILYSKTKEGEKSSYYSKKSEVFFGDIPVVVLVNGNSASAAEVFAGALSCYDRAKLVGETTFGKGIMQSTFRLTDGTGIKLTIGKYYLPDDSNIHEVGLEPDYEAKFSEDITNIWKLEHKDDVQLQKAIEVVKNK